MITLLQSGKYTLLQAIEEVKALLLDKKLFGWDEVVAEEELVFFSLKQFHPIGISTTGKYRLYEVKGEKKLVNAIHLELFAGDGKWEGYLLPDGLPTKEVPRKKIVRIDQTITKVTH
jgi:hypothetical protein